MKKFLLALLVLAITISLVAFLDLNLQVRKMEPDIYFWSSLQATEVDSESEVNPEVSSDSSRAKKENKFKDFILICFYVAGAMLIVAGSISNFDGVIIAIGSAIFGFSIAGIYDLFPREKKPE